MIGARRRGVPLGAARAVRFLPGFPAIARAEHSGVDLAAWAASAREEIEAVLRTTGALRLEGFAALDRERFAALIEATREGPLLEYRYRSTPRQHLGDRIYTSTEYPAALEIPLHNEMSYTSRWPARLWFGCLAAPGAGGETTLADARRVLARLPDELVRRFEAKGVRYVRRYGSGADLGWAETFQAASLEEAIASARANGLTAELIDGALRTEETCAATAVHPRTGERVWFNQAHLFHPSSLPAELRSALARASGEAEPPRTATFGDGGPLELDDLQAIRAAYAAERVAPPWQTGEVLIVDNLLVCHGRARYAGPRSVLVAMAGGREVSEGDAGG